MRQRVAAALAAALLATGSVACLRRSSTPYPLSHELSTLLAEGTALYGKGRYLESQDLFQQGYARALKLGDIRSASRFINSVGGARFAAFRYKEALRAFLEARRLARQTGDSEMQAMVSCNLSSLYLQQQDLNAGARAAEETLAALRQAGPTKWGPLLRAQGAILHARQGRLDLGLPLFYEAIEEAEARGDTVTTSLIWDQMGHELLLVGKLNEAEHSLVEAFRQRKLNRLAEVGYSYYTLGRLRLAQGDAIGADRLLSESIASLARTGGTLAAWRVYYERGRARMQAQRLVAALSDLRSARELAKRARLEVLPADSAWINTGVDQSRLTSELIRAAGTLYFQGRSPSLARLAFEASEENRAAGLRALIYSPDEWRRRLPPEYWETLARLRWNEAALLRTHDASVNRDSSFLQYRLTEMEAEAGLGLSTSPGMEAENATDVIRRARRALGPDEVLFSFNLQEPHSFLWAITRSDFRMFRLPAGGRIEALSKRFRDEVEKGRKEASSTGESLFGELFGSVPGHILAKPRWVLALDGELFRLPFAALVLGYSSGSPRYLAESHSIMITPSALLLNRGRGPGWHGPFVGLGDPIYNAADPRRAPAGGHWPGRKQFFLHILPPVFAGTDISHHIELPRLVGSGIEIEACVRELPDDGQKVLLTGAEATLRRLDEALSRNPSVLHLATHFLTSAGDTRQALTALSLDPAGEPELLGPVEISRKRVELDLVVLSGCSSGTGAALPAEGLMGMTRAWLAAGSRSVLATLWPTPDDQGRLLVSFYKHLTRLRDRGDGWIAADALRMAQLDMLRSDSWHASPRRWGAYILAGKE
jgi:CHAT domain-containing protein/tetratricopeptide (TPR) repeat protein